MRLAHTFSGTCLLLACVDQLPAWALQLERALASVPCCWSSLSAQKRIFLFCKLCRIVITTFWFKAKELALTFGLTLSLRSWECLQFLHPEFWVKVWNAVDTPLVFSRPRPACFVQWLKEPERGSEISRKWHMFSSFSCCFLCAMSGVFCTDARKPALTL